MENQHRKIAGYRELSQEEIDLMNRIKEFGPQLEALCEDLISHIEGQLLNAYAANSEEEAERIVKAEAIEWLEQGKKNLQLGLMCLTRSVAQPSFF